MDHYFNIPFEFNPTKVDAIIEDSIKNNIVGYVCAVDCTNLSVAYDDEFHLMVLNQSLVNKSDSSWIPVLVNRLYGTDYSRYCGPDLFLNFIKKRCYRHLFLGSSKQILDGLQVELTKIDSLIADMKFVELPFLTVNEFEYQNIANIINDNKPDIIWVALGAPKQEQFMYYLKPYIKRGVMVGVGAVFNFYSGISNAPKRAPQWMIRLRLEFVYRIFSEPQKQLKRCWKILKSLPIIYMEEKKRSVDQKKNNVKK